MLLRTEPPAFSDDAVKALADDLRHHVRGEVRFSDLDRALYSVDASNYRQVPIGVVLPLDANDVVEAVAACRRHNAPILHRGCATSLGGQTTNVAVVLDHSKYFNRVVELDAERKLARVQPGCIFDDLRDAAERHGLTAAFDTSTHDYATVGGMIGNNACGVHSVLAQSMGVGSGRASDCVEEMEILTYDGVRMRVGRTSDEELEKIIAEGGRRGEIYGKLKELRDRYAELIRERYPDIPRRVSGYNLTQLLPEFDFNVARALVGTEGTCVTILEATVRLLDNPPKRALLVIGYDSVYEAGDHAADVIAAKPVGLEALDERLIENMRRKKLHVEHLELLPEGGGWLLAEFGGDSEEEAAAQAKAVRDKLQQADNPPRDTKLYTDKDDQERVWLIRESGLGATAYVPGREDNWPGWEDSAVPPERVGEYLRDLRELFHRFGYDAALYGHFGQGCIHCRINFDLASEDGIKTWRRFMEEATDLVVRYGGSMAGEHGDGQARAELLPRMYGEEIVQAFREFKGIFDPDNRMNPGKVVDPYPMDANLRLGARYKRPELKTHFQYPDDNGSFSRAILRCVGVGKCRHKAGGVMCPSFMATRDEKHTTRGRARALFEMLHHPGPIENSWKSEAVHEALDLCLACKGCKSDCPVNVDMATYKAEFNSHYYQGRLRPPAAYAMGWIYWWSKLAGTMPRVANAVMHAPGLSALIKAAGGIHQQRIFPRYAPQTFRDWFKQRGPRNVGGRPVMLFPDTFNNHFRVPTAKAAVEVLEAAGFEVRIPERSLCCGRPLYVWGMLDTAKKQLGEIMDTLAPAAAQKIPVVGLEPACVAAFRDELINLFPKDERAQQLAKSTVMLSELLKDSGWTPPKLHRKALVHFHCNHHAIMGKGPEEDVLAAMELDYETLDSGCCGMAGSFGFEKDHYDVAMTCGERVLLPAVRAADPDTLIITSGFSCREQIAQATERDALHLAEVIQMALRSGEEGVRSPYPERADVPAPA